jgi:multidrug efflux pump subunit AcrA (membrane-fusion protein)
MPEGYSNSGYYNSQASDLQYRYNTDKSANAYGRFLSQQRGSRGLGDMSRNFGNQLPAYKAQFGQRGLSGPGVRSGAMQRSMGNYLGDYTTAYQRAQQDMTQEAQQYDLASAGLDAQYNNSLAALEQQKQDEIANAARAIEMLRPYLGGT